MFPPAGAQVYYNEAGEPLGWDSPSAFEPEYDPDDFYEHDPEYDDDDDDDDDDVPAMSAVDAREIWDNQDEYDDETVARAFETLTAAGWE